MKAGAYRNLPTEQANPRSRRIDSLSTQKILALMNREDETVPRAVRKAIPAMERAVGWIARSLAGGGRLFFAGAGSSGRLAVIEAAECPPTFSTPPSRVQAIMAGGHAAVFRSREGAEDRRREAWQVVCRKVRRGDVLVAITASGVTPFVRGALQAARQRGARTVLVAANARAPLARNADCLIAPRVGPELIAGSTRLKAGTATKLILNMLTVATMVRLGKVYRNWMVDLQPRSRKLRARALALVERLAHVRGREAARYFAQARNNVKLAILMARNRCDYPAARRLLKRSSGRLQ